MNQHFEIVSLSLIDYYYFSSLNYSWCFAKQRFSSFSHHSRNCVAWHYSQLFHLRRVVKLWIVTINQCWGTFQWIDLNRVGCCAAWNFDFVWAEADTVILARWWSLAPPATQARAPSLHVFATPERKSATHFGGPRPSLDSKSDYSCSIATFPIRHHLLHWFTRGTSRSLCFPI